MIERREKRRAVCVAEKYFTSEIFYYNSIDIYKARLHQLSKDKSNWRVRDKTHWCHHITKPWNMKIFFESDKLKNIVLFVDEFEWNGTIFMPRISYPWFLLACIVYDQAL